MKDLQFQKIIKKEDPSNIFEVYQNEFIGLLEKRYLNIDFAEGIIEEILYTIEIIKDIFPKNATYSKSTKELIRVASDLLSLSYSPFLNNNSNSIEKLKLALLYLNSTLPIVELSNTDLESFSYKSYKILFNEFNNGFNKYITKSVSPTDAALANMVINNPHYELTIDDEIFLNHFITKKLNVDSEIWDLIFVFSKTDHKALNLMYIFVEFLRLYLPQEDIYILELNKGSIRGRVRAYFKSKEIEEDVIEGLNDVKKYAKGKLTKEFQESEKIRKEKELLDLEKKLQEQKIEENSYYIEQNKAEIEIQKLQLEKEKLELENDKLRIENFKSKLELLKELLADSIISQQDFKIYLNDSLLIEKTIKNIEINKSFNDEEE